MLLPPNAYRADERAGRRALPRGRQGRAADRRLQQPDRHQGRPDARSCSPELHGEGLIVGGQGVHRRRAPRATGSPSWRPASTCSCGADDVALELAIAGAAGWVAGYPNALPAGVRRAVPAATAGDLADGALPLYRAPAPAAALGLPDRVRPGDQAVDGHRRPLRRTVPAAARAADRRARRHAVRQATEKAARAEG